MFDFHFTTLHYKFINTNSVYYQLPLLKRHRALLERATEPILILFQEVIIFHPHPHLWIRFLDVQLEDTGIKDSEDTENTETVKVGVYANKDN